MHIFKSTLTSSIFLFILSISLFGYGYSINTINGVILHMLEFTVVFELVRTFTHYLKDGRIKVRYGLDAAIFFTIKELYVGFSEFKIDGSYALIAISCGVLVVLMGLRHFNATLIEEQAKLCTGKCDA